MSEQFVPMVLQITTNNLIDYANTTITFDYNMYEMALPQDKTQSPEGRDGAIRIWTHDGHQVRVMWNLSDNGQLIENGIAFTLEELGFLDEYGNLITDTITLYVEGMEVSSTFHNTIVVNMEYTLLDNSVLTVSDTVTYRVTEEDRWGVTRNSNSPTAPATPTDGSTIVELAYEVGLNPHEFRNWLTITGGSTVNLLDGSTKPVADLEVYDVLSGTQTVQFAVPNTILMAWFGEVGGLGQWWMSFEKNKEYLEAIGFSVAVFNNDIYPHIDFTGIYSDLLPNPAHAEFTSTIQHLSLLTKQLHGLYLMGHGSYTPGASVGSAVPNAGCIGPIWDIGYTDGQYTTSKDAISNYLGYNLASLIIHACYGDNSDARSLVGNSDNAILWGVDDIYEPIPFFDDFDPIVKFWGYESYTEGIFTQYLVRTFGGKQKTNTFTTRELLSSSYD